MFARINPYHYILIMTYSLKYFLTEQAAGNASGACKWQKADKIYHLTMVIGWGMNHRIEQDTGLQVSASGWNPVTQRCKRGSMHGSELSATAWIVNRHLLELERNVARIMAAMKDGVDESEVKRIVSKGIEQEDKIERSAKTMIGKSDSLPLLECIKWYVDEQRLLKGWSLSTQNKLHELASYLRAFMPDAQLKDIDRDWLCKFLSSLESNGLRNVTIHKLLEMLRWFVRWALDAQLMTNDAALHFHPLLKKIPRKVIFLTWKELMRVWTLDLEDDQPLRVARDLFCLQCFTSLRYSDVSLLKNSQVKADCIELVTRKTAEPLTIELNQYAKEILNRYKGLCDPYAMPRMTVQRVNLLLKQIGQLASLDEPIQMVWYVGSQRREEVRAKKDLLSTHCGRRTFICCSLAMGIPAETVMRWTGHSNYRSMKPYIAVADDTKRREMSKWDTWAQKIQDRAPS